MEIIEEAARIGGFHDDLTVSISSVVFDISAIWHSTCRRAVVGRDLHQVAIAIFDDAAFLDRAISAGAACSYLRVCACDIPKPF